MHALVQDLRYAFRQFGRAPAFTAVAVITLALGIGANTALFSLLSAVFLRPLPGVRDADRLVWVSAVTEPGGRTTNMSYPSYTDLRDRTSVFDGLATFGDAPFSIVAGGEPERVRGQIVSGNYFEVLRTPFAAGRGFLAEEDRTPGTHPVAVLSHRYWTTRFAADQSVIGRRVTVNGQPFTIVGVAARGFNGVDLDEPRDIWVPTMMVGSAMPMLRKALTARGTWWLTSVGRLEDGVTVAQAEAAVATVGRQLRAAYPDVYEGMGAGVMAMRGGVSPGDAGDAIPVSLLAFGVTGVVLLISCANVANLLLGRGASRRREVGVRLALGAGRGRLVQQLLTESLALAAVGAVVGLLASFWATELAVRYLQAPIPLDLSPDWRIVAFAAAMALATGIVFGLAPALQATRRDVIAALREATVGRGAQRSRMQNGFVIAQVALSLVLLVTSGLFLRSMQKATTIDPGFDASTRVATASFDLGLQGYSRERSLVFFRSALARARALPGVEAASLSDIVPLSGRLVGGEMYAEGALPSTGGGAASVNTSVVAPDYFRTIGMPMARGRDFSDADDASASAVVILNEAAARRAWGDADPIGRRVSFAGERGPFLEVIGVARNAKYDALNEDPRPYVYLPAWQQPNQAGDMTLLVRSRSDAAPLIASLRRELRALDPNVPVYAVRTLDETLRVKLDERGRGSSVLVAFALLALILATVGVYGVMAYAVAQRTNEIGVRMALGAHRSDVMSLFIGEGVRLSAIGIVVGATIAFAVTRLLASMLYGVTPTDAVTFAVVAGLLCGAAVLASYLPARRAARVDPVVALRSGD